MKPQHFSTRDFIWILPLSLLLGAGLASLQPGNWFIGWAGFSFLFLLSFFILTLATRWAGGGKVLAWMVALAFFLRIATGVATYLLLPVNGYNEPDDKAGFVFTDAHRRDNQAWELASSRAPIYKAFSQKYAYDQYGGLLAFSALVYRYFSPDVHRPLMLTLLSALIAALGIPFLWRAASLQWGEKVALVSGWLFVLYPESILLGSEAMREPYLMTFSAMALWGFVEWRASPSTFVLRRPPLPLRGLRSAMLWLGIALAGMLLISPAIALVTLIILGGWLFFTNERGRIPWWVIASAVLVFVVGLFILSSALNRQGNLNAGTPVGIIGAFVREAVKWDVYQLERGSGWVQKLFDTMPSLLRLPFVVTYGVLQPVLPATFFEPTTLTWQVIGILRAAGWYTLLPVLVFALLTGAGQGADEKRGEVKLWLWLSLIIWGWILFSSLRGGGDQWDNPRYRAILFLWQALVAGQAFVWWRETRHRWFPRILAGELAFLLVFTEWYASRYYHVGWQMPFGWMIILILGLWAVIFAGGWWWDRRRRHA